MYVPVCRPMYVYVPVYRPMCVCILCACKCVWMHGWMDGWTGGWKDERMGECACACVRIRRYVRMYRYASMAICIGIFLYVCFMLSLQY